MTDFNFTYSEPLNYTIGPKPLTIAKVKHGVTEISLSDGRLVRVSLHVESVKDNGATLDVNYSAIVEIMTEPALPVLDVHEVIQ